MPCVLRHILKITGGVLFIQSGGHHCHFDKFLALNLLIGIKISIVIAGYDTVCLHFIDIGICPVRGAAVRKCDVRPWCIVRLFTDSISVLISSAAAGNTGAARSARSARSAGRRCISARCISFCDLVDCRLKGLADRIGIRKILMINLSQRLLFVRTPKRCKFLVRLRADPQRAIVGCKMILQRVLRRSVDHGKNPCFFKHGFDITAVLNADAAPVRFTDRNHVFVNILPVGLINFILSFCREDIRDFVHFCFQHLSIGRILRKIRDHIGNPPCRCDIADGLKASAIAVVFHTDKVLQPRRALIFGNRERQRLTHSFNIRFYLICRRCINLF